MKMMPTSSREWGRLLLFPFKAYTVLGVCAFIIWLHRTWGLNPWLREQTAGWFVLGYLLSSLVLITGGMIQKYAIKSDAATSSFVFGLTGLLLGFFVIPALIPG